MKHQPFTEPQTLDRLWYFATNGKAAEAEVIASACYWLTQNPECDVAADSRWHEILREFTERFRTHYPKGMSIPIPPSTSPRLDQASRQCSQANPNLPAGVPPIPAPHLPPRPPRDLRRYEPSLVEALRLWEETKAVVFGATCAPACNPIASPPPPCAPTAVPRPTQSLVAPPPAPPPIPRRLIGGSAGEPIENDADESPATAAIPSARNPATPPALPLQQRPDSAAPSFFSEVTVRPAKANPQESGTASLIDATALEATERETAEVDSMLAAMLGAADDTIHSAKNKPSR